MNIKKLKLISTFLVILFSFLTHSIYDIFPNIITSLFFPVNESIWEHMKIILICYCIVYIIELIFIYKYNLQNKNQKASLLFNVLFNIIFYLIIYIPIYNLIGFNEIITISTYIISIIITEILSYKIISSNKDYTFLNRYSYLIIFILFLLFIYLTYFPLKNNIFIDKTNKKLGISNLY